MMFGVLGAIAVVGSAIVTDRIAERRAARRARRNGTVDATEPAPATIGDAVDGGQVGGTPAMPGASADLAWSDGVAPGDPATAEPLHYRQRRPAVATSAVPSAGAVPLDHERDRVAAGRSPQLRGPPPQLGELADARQDRGCAAGRVPASADHRSAGRLRRARTDGRAAAVRAWVACLVLPGQQASAPAARCGSCWCMLWVSVLLSAFVMYFHWMPVDELAGTNRLPRHARCASPGDARGRRRARPARRDLSVGRTAGLRHLLHGAGRHPAGPDAGIDLVELHRQDPRAS